MSPAKRPFTFALSDALKIMLQEVKRREGVSEAEQIRRGLRLWFESKGYRFDDDGQPILSQSKTPKAIEAARSRLPASKRSVRKS